MDIEIAGRLVGHAHPTYFIADIGANHDGSLDRAKSLIALAKEAGADAAKFQNFHARQIVSDVGFESFGQVSHQAAWKSSVVEVYENASLPDDWTLPLKQECERVGIDYFSSPYDFGAVDLLTPHVPVFKIGSGDIDWLESLEYMASKGKPILLATGAADIGEVQRAVHTVRAINEQIVLMQCNTNYTGSVENFAHVHLNVLRTFASMWPDVVLGLSDHTPGHSAVLGAVALGARVIEKHFTDDNDREGPDHPFALDPIAWREMVDRTRELEQALGSGDKFVAANEQETVFIQRRCLRAARDLAPGDVLDRDAIDILRPAEPVCIRPPQLDAVVGRTVGHPIARGTAIQWSDLSK